MRLPRASLLVLVLLATAVRAGDEAAHATITKERFKAAVDKLAGPECAGRNPGTAGSKVAGDWLAAQLQAIGLEPAGDGGTFFHGFTTWEKKKKMRNVVASLAPKRGSIVANEVVVVGGHYDHLGLGDHHSLDPISGANLLHAGADDNASGCAGVLEIARAFAAAGPAARRVVFVFFDAEENGCLGSKHYVEKPPFPIKTTVGMINLDMVGRCREGRVSVYGSETGVGLRKIVEDSSAGLGLTPSLPEGALRNSDHAIFHDAGVPVVYFTTGVHPEYHTAGDTADRVNADGGARIARFSYSVARRLAEAKARLEVAPMADKTDARFLEEYDPLMARSHSEGREADAVLERLRDAKKEPLPPPAPAPATPPGPSKGLVGGLDEGGQTTKDGKPAPAKPVVEKLPEGKAEPWVLNGSWSVLDTAGTRVGGAVISNGASDDVDLPPRFEIVYRLDDGGLPRTLGFSGTLSGSALTGVFLDASVDPPRKRAVTYTFRRSKEKLVLEPVSGTTETLVRTVEK